MHVGSEFFRLCHEQINLLVQGLGASLAIIALVEHPTKGGDTGNLAFVPIVTYADGFSNIDPQALMMWLSEVWTTDIVTATEASYSSHATDPATSSLSFISKQTKSEETIVGDIPLHEFANTPSWAVGEVPVPDNLENLRNENHGSVMIEAGALEYRSPLAFHQERVVLPLLYQDMMMGILVTARVDRGWSQPEQYNIERIAQTLAAACVMDQRSQWLEQQLKQQTMTYAQLHEHQQDRLDDILHQFRNPLTALRTFGKLLVKRLQPLDRNRTVAESIVRESDRLQELLTQLNETATLPMPALPGALSAPPATIDTDAPPSAPGSTPDQASTMDSSWWELLEETEATRSEATSLRSRSWLGERFTMLTREFEKYRKSFNRATSSPGPARHYGYS